MSKVHAGFNIKGLGLDLYCLFQVIERNISSFRTTGKLCLVSSHVF